MAFLALPCFLLCGGRCGLDTLQSFDLAEQHRQIAVTGGGGQRAHRGRSGALKSICALLVKREVMFRQNAAGPREGVAMVVHVSVGDRDLAAAVLVSLLVVELAQDIFGLETRQHLVLQR